jgi:hypothetical protein
VRVSAPSRSTRRFGYNSYSTMRTSTTLAAWCEGLRRPAKWRGSGESSRSKTDLLHHAATLQVVLVRASRTTHHPLRLKRYAQPKP